jgi:hypothetical protein
MGVRFNERVPRYHAFFLVVAVLCFMARMVQGHGQLNEPKARNVVFYNGGGGGWFYSPQNGNGIGPQPYTQGIIGKDRATGHPSVNPYCLLCHAAISSVPLFLPLADAVKF